MKEYAQIAVELPVEGEFTYMIPQELKDACRMGRRVLVPFGKRTVTGYVLGLASSPPPGVKGLKPVMDVLDDGPLFDEKRLKFLRWVSSYYFSPLGEVLGLLNPGGTKIRSRRRFRPAVSAVPSDRGGLERELLEASKGGALLSTLLGRFKGRPVHSAIERLRKEGLLTEETVLEGGASSRLEKAVSLKDAAFRPDPRRSPIQAKVLRYLEEKGPSTLNQMRKDLGEVAQAIKRLGEKGAVEVYERDAPRDPFSGITPRKAPFEPNAEQRAALGEILKSLGHGGFSAFLLYGVTGSGKTLVYLKALEAAVAAGRKAIFLSPEIALTPWPAAYLSERFPGRVALAHSGLSPGERYDEWKRILRGEADIVVGARSALFSPIKDLGMIIVDEEHETSYKDENGVRYNARDAALMLGKSLGITVVLGSATPSLESFYNASAGKLKLLSMKKRVEERPLPEIEVMDMKGMKGEVFSGRLKSLISDTLSSGGQALLFLNRRGFSSSLLCRDCGHLFMCLNCSVSLTMHKAKKALLCHYCDLSMPLPSWCPSCKGTNLIQPGAGTEKIEEEIRTLFPEARTGRMDRDTTRKKGSAKKIIDSVEEKKLDILIGTQMISKGHHFPGISLVGVISGDTSLGIPDFRGSERTFQLITQAAGRAGRGDVPGKVVIQTLNPQHYCFKNAAGHDYEGFYGEELRLREEAFYPPFSRLAVLRVEGLKEEAVVSAAMALKAKAERLLAGKRSSVSILGPAPALISRIKNRFRWQMLIKGSDTRELHGLVSALRNDFNARDTGRVTLIVDMDPLTVA